MSVYQNINGTLARMDASDLVQLAAVDTEGILGGTPGAITDGQTLVDQLAADDVQAQTDIGQIKTDLSDQQGEIDAILNVYGSKNLINSQLGKSETVGGVTFTLNADGTISTSGQSSGVFWHRIIPDASTIDFINNVLQSGVEYVLTGLPSGVPNGIGISMWSGDTIAYVRPDHMTDTFTKPSSPVTVSNTNLSIGTGSTSTVNWDGLVFKPMIRDARIKDPTFVPFAMTNRELTEELEFGQANATLDSTYIDTANSAIYLRKWGHICVLFAQLKTQSNLSFDTALTIATVPDGFKPKFAKSDSTYDTGSGSTTERHDFGINTNGNVTLTLRNTHNAVRWICASTTYICE